MISPNDFWLQLHRLAEAYTDEGTTEEERAINITDELLSLPPAVRMQARDDFRQLAESIDNLAPIIAAVLTILT